MMIFEKKFVCFFLFFFDFSTDWPYYQVTIGNSLKLLQSKSFLNCTIKMAYWTLYEISKIILIMKVTHECSRWAMFSSFTSSPRSSMTALLLSPLPPSLRNVQAVSCSPLHCHCLIVVVVIVITIFRRSTLSVSVKFARCSISFDFAFSSNWTTWKTQ